MVPGPSNEQITQLLVDWSNGDQCALDALTPLVYGELRRLAHSYMRQERSDHTLQSTELVHEAFVRMVNQKVSWKSRAHFFGIAAQMMRRILVDHAKKHNAIKRGSGFSIESLDDSLIVAQQSMKDILVLDDALTELEKIDPQRSRIVELRFFSGLSNDESAEILGISSATVQRQWTGAKAWLYHEISRRST